MHWLRRLMKRSGIRRRQSRSSSSSPPGASPFKKRAYAKDASYTEGESLCSSDEGDTRSALWRAENIRKGQGPPTEDEWWRTVSSDPQGSDDSDDNVETVAHISPSARRFHNCGLETWEVARTEWNKQTVKKRPSKAPLIGYAELSKGLSKSTGCRTYELPRRMALSDLIGVYTQDIWNGDAS